MKIIIDVDEHTLIITRSILTMILENEKYVLPEGDSKELYKKSISKLIIELGGFAFGGGEKME